MIATIENIEQVLSHNYPNKKFNIVRDTETFEITIYFDAYMLQTDVEQMIYHTDHVFRPAKLKFERMDF